MAIYIVIAALVGLLAVVAIYALAVGLLAAGGLVRMMRCANCGHFTLSGMSARPRSCPYCRHEHLAQLAHPLATLHHSHVLSGRH